MYNILIEINNVGWPVAIMWIGVAWAFAWMLK